MATFEDLYDYVLPYLPGAEPGIVDFHIRRALREFFKRTTVWREVFTFDTVANTESYSLQPVEGTVSSLLRVDVDGTLAQAVPEDRRDPHQAPTVPTGWYNLLPQVVTLYPTPAAVYPVRVEAVLTLPIASASRVFPDNVRDEHIESIAAGVISGMMSMPGKPWTQYEAAAMYHRIFGAAIRDTRGKLRDGGQPNQSTFIGVRRFGA